MTDKRPLLDEKTRVRIYYFLGEEFPKEESRGGMFDGYMGGEEQQLLEKKLRKELAVLKLPGSGGSTDEILKNFILSADEKDVLVMLGLMPVVKFEVDMSSYDQSSAVKRAVDLVNRIEAMLGDFGIQAKFNPDRHEFEVIGDVDASPKALADLPQRPTFESDVELRMKSDQPFCVVFIDLDDFKAINDRKSHQAGNECLATVATIIGDAVSLKGKLYRYGGDEFAVILPNSVRDEGVATAERIRRSIDDGNPGGDIKVTASIGVAQPDATLKTAADLVDAADSAAFASKATSKNNIYIYRSRALQYSATPSHS